MELQTDKKTTILVVDDDQAIRGAVTHMLQKGDRYRVVEASTLGDGLSILQRLPVDVVLTDLRIGDESGLDLIRAVRTTYPDTETLVMTAYGSIEGAVEAMQTGAFDYLTKPFGTEQLIHRIEKALERKSMRTELQTLRQHVALSYGFDNIVGISKPIQQLKETARRISPTDITILITGPSGTGKELLARAIHHHSNRRLGRFVAIDCSAIPEALLESELFGHMKGSFTSATGSKKGLFEEADGGTVFLDELANMPPAVQVKLLRFLQDSIVRPVGSSEFRKVDVRIIGATNRDLTELIAAGTFREDLYYRLSVIPLSLPPLVNRIEDLELLVDYFLRKIAVELKKGTITITRPAVDALLSHRWPGNIRELENTLKRGAALCRENQIDASDISFVGGEQNDTMLSLVKQVHSGAHKGRLMDAGQKTLILKTLSDNGWNYTQTAQALGIGRTTLWRKLKKYELKSEPTDQSMAESQAETSHD